MLRKDQLLKCVVFSIHRSSKSCDDAGDGYDYDDGYGVNVVLGWMLWG